MQNIQINTLFIGKPVIYLPTCHSTNTVAQELSPDDSFFEGTLIITSHQTAGRGQQGNQWQASANKNFTFSLLLKPKFLKASEQFNLNMAISLGITNFLAFHLNKPDIKIKWPNDIFYKNNKICGILIENVIKQTFIEKSVVGIGINVNQTDFEYNSAISMQMATGLTYSLEKLLPELLECIEEQYLQLMNGHYDKIKQNYLKVLFRYGEVASFKKENTLFEGEIIGIDAIGRLAVRIENELQYFNFKEIEFVY